ncbi:hypothetical protein SY83_11230 [Paenibacillus swuensis]|uniref:Uncharacterized protein n=2 Tax=Paenibacillus swuensis TaxID=1178515 RepID=A0A172TI64_9BACL|nr:hypothetical protein SY83_11230 [Paenibacillus swuensis]
MTAVGRRIISEQCSHRMQPVAANTSGSKFRDIIRELPPVDIDLQYNLAVIIHLFSFDGVCGVCIDSSIT